VRPTRSPSLTQLRSVSLARRRVSFRHRRRRHHRRRRRCCRCRHRHRRRRRHRRYHRCCGRRVGLQRIRAFQTCLSRPPPSERHRATNWVSEHAERTRAGTRPIESARRCLSSSLPLGSSLPSFSRFIRARLHLSPSRRPPTPPTRCHRSPLPQ